MSCFNGFFSKATKEQTIYLKRLSMTIIIQQTFYFPKVEMKKFSSRGRKFDDDECTETLRPPKLLKLAREQLIRDFFDKPELYSVLKANRVTLNNES